MVREFEGLQPVLDLMKSEYAIVQRLALLTLDRLTQDSRLNVETVRQISAKKFIILAFFILLT